MSDAFIACMNIEKFRELIRYATDERRRQMLLTLLADEERKIAEMSLPGDGQDRDGGSVPMASPRTRKS